MRSPHWKKIPSYTGVSGLHVKQHRPVNGPFYPPTPPQHFKKTEPKGAMMRCLQDNTGENYV